MRSNIGDVTRDYLPILLCLPVVLIWQAAVTLLFRKFAIPAPLGRSLGGNAIRQLTRRQCVWIVGVLQWGIGMFLFFECLGVIRWRYWADPFYAPSMWKTLLSLALWVIMGFVFGQLMWKLQYERDDA